MVKDTVSCLEAFCIEEHEIWNKGDRVLKNSYSAIIAKGLILLVHSLWHIKRTVVEIISVYFGLTSN